MQPGQSNGEEDVKASPAQEKCRWVSWLQAVKLGALSGSPPPPRPIQPSLLSLENMFLLEN